MTQPSEQSSETRVRAAVPDANLYAYIEGHRAGVWGTVGNIETWLGYTWDDACTSSAVRYFERTNRPSVVAFEASRAPGKADKPQYIPWTHAGGPNECKHGYAEGIPCPHCDAEKVASLPSSAEPRTFKEWFANMTDGQPLSEDISKQMRIVANAAWNFAWHAALASAAAPRVTWKVEQLVHAEDDEWVRVVGHAERERVESYMQESNFPMRLVKIETTETIVEIRTKEGTA